MHAPAHARQHGTTLVELMVGLAVGLFIVASALGLAMSQLHDDRSLLQESRLMTHLQSAADIVTHDLRRAGYRGDAGIGIARSGADPVADAYAGIDGSGTDAGLLFSYSRDAVENQSVDSNERFGFHLKGGAIEMLIGDSGWQAVTDAAAITVTDFSLTPVVEDLSLGSFCEQPCPATDADCPRQQIRRYDLALAARSVADPHIVRELKTSVRVRNDLVTGACPAWPQ